MNGFNSVRQMATTSDRPVSLVPPKTQLILKDIKFQIDIQRQYSQQQIKETLFN